MNQWFNNLNQGTNESMNQRNMLPTSSSKSAPILSAFLILRCKSNSRYSLVHILPSSFSKSAPSMPIFQHLQIELSPTSCALFADNFPRSSREPAETETLPVLWRRQEPHYPKKHKVSRAKLLSPVNSHVPKLLLSSTASTRALLLLTILT